MALKHFKPAEVFPPGEYLREELAARGWTQGDLAKVIGRPTQVVNEIINGKKAITAQTAKELGLALGTGPELWANLQVYYDLHSTPDADTAIGERAKRIA